MRKYTDVHPVQAIDLPLLSEETAVSGGMRSAELFVLSDKLFCAGHALLQPVLQTIWNVDDLNARF